MHNVEIADDTIHRIRIMIDEWHTEMNAHGPLSKWDLAIIGGQAIGTLGALIDQVDEKAPPVAPSRPQMVDHGTNRPFAWEYNGARHAPADVS